jgi:hypothetical protein
MEPEESFRYFGVAVICWPVSARLAMVPWALTEVIYKKALYRRVSRITRESTATVAAEKFATMAVWLPGCASGVRMTAGEPAGTSVLDVSGLWHARPEMSTRSRDIRMSRSMASI